MNATSVDVADMLEDVSSLALAIGVNLFIGKEPTNPDNCVTIYDTPGFPAQLSLDDTNNNYYHPSVQIRVRNKDYRDGWDLLNNIKVALHSINHVTVNGTLYTVINCAQEPFLLDWEEGHKRCRFILNLNIQRRT